MKKNLTLILSLFITVGVYAQVPEKLSYQAIIRNSNDQLVINQDIGIKISILKGSVSGSAVYTEIFNPNPTTNTNGLLSLEIGTGIPTTGTFSKIDWASGIYFIKTETDPNGGTNYTITSTSQLLGVPYALHAKTADSLTGPLYEKDPVFTASQAAKITAKDITNLSNLSGTNTGNQDISGINKNTQAIKDTAFKIRRSFPLIKTYAIGDFAHGGIVFWLDSTGQHGLVCAKQDQSTGIRWNAGTSKTTRAKGAGVYAGKSNTAIIIPAHIAIGDDGNPYAASICHDLIVIEGGVRYGDWYLPSREELNHLLGHKTVVNATASNNGGSSLASSYWSSSEYSATSACEIQTSSVGSFFITNKTTLHKVRAVRSF